jgi:hypothetical protein
MSSKSPSKSKKVNRHPVTAGFLFEKMLIMGKFYKARKEKINPWGINNYRTIDTRRLFLHEEWVGCFF